jgi:hypothetical protein
MPVYAASMVLNAISGVVGIIISMIKGVFIDMPTWLIGTIVSGMNAIFLQFPAYVANTIIDGFVNIVSAIPRALYDSLYTAASTVGMGWLVEKMTGGAGKPPSVAGGAVETGGKNATSMVGNVMEALKKTFIDIPTWLGSTIISGFKQLFIDMPIWLGQTIMDGIVGIVSGIPEALYNALYAAASAVNAGWIVKGMFGGGVSTSGETSSSQQSKVAAKKKGEENNIISITSPEIIEISQEASKQTMLQEELVDLFTKVLEALKGPTSQPPSGSASDNEADTSMNKVKTRPPKFYRATSGLVGQTTAKQVLNIGPPKV